MQRKATKEWIGAIAKGRREAGLAGKRHTQGHEGHERLEALGRRHVARDVHERRIERGRVRIMVGRDIRAAHPAFAVGRGELPWIEPGLGHNRRIARGGTFSSAVDGPESLRLVALDSVERAIDERKARRGVEVLWGSHHACRRKRRVRGQGARILTRFVDRVGLGGPRLDAGLGKRGIGARGVFHVCAGRCRWTENPDRAESVGRVWGRALAPPTQGLSARLRLSECSDACAALFEPGLPGHDFVQFAFEGIPLEQLSARSFIEPRARFGQTVLIIRLHFHLPREDCAHQVVVEGDIKGDGGGPGEREQRKRRNRPNADPPEPDASDGVTPGERKAIKRPRRPRLRIVCSQRHEPALQPSESGRAQPQSKAH